MFGRTILVLLLLWTQDSVKSLRLIELRVPTHEREGGLALLDCQYDLQGDTLYNVKWYKDGHEFYRYVPKNDPPVYYFPMAGVYVELGRSSNTAVALVNLTQESSGDYSCEVNGEAPKFATVIRHKNINIHLLPKSGPHVVGLKDQYYMDDLVVANCSLAPSRPKAHLMWYVNGRRAPTSYISGPWYRMSTERPDAAESILQISFFATPSDFVNGAIKLKCQATIAPLYQKETESIHYIALPFTEAKENKDAASTSSVKNTLASLLIPMFFLILM